MSANRYRFVFIRHVGSPVRASVMSSSRGHGNAALIVARPGFCRVSLRPLAVAVALALAFAGGGLAAPPLPVGGQVVGGSGSISQSGTTLTVQQNSARLSANWQSFDIAAGHSVVFIQPSANAVALNRVLGGSRSEIYGNLSANGQVFLINPNGVLFGKTAEVNVGSLLATTRDISDTDFMAGRYRFTDTGGKGDVVNQGNLKAVDGGFVVLAGTRVSNEGTISATGGTVALAAGETIALDLDSGGQLKVRVDGAVLQALTENRGLIEADGGQVFLTARGKDMLQSSAINLTGVIRARGIREKNGVVVLDGGDDGAVLVDGGRIDVSSDTGHGGTAVVSGRLIGVVDGALIDAAGRDGGGRVIIGGDLLGKVSEILSVRLADRTVVDGSARIRIGAALGDGGFVETSGRCVAIDGTIDGASAGTAGRWLIDPLNVTIGAADANGSWSGGAPNIFTPSATGSTVSAASIQTALNAGTAVEVTTGSTGSEAGDITLSSSITKTAGGDTSLTLTAAGSINTNGGINVTSGQLATTFNANGGAISGSGSINTNGGLLTLNAASGFGILNSVISGTGGLRKTGAGTQVIMVGFYTGATTVNAGTLQVGFGASGNSISAASAVTVDAGATMAWNSANNSTPVTIGNALSGAGTVLLKGSNNSSHTGYSTYSLTGNNAGFSGTLVLNSAILAGVTAQSQLGTAAIDVQTNSTLGLAGATIANAITVENGAGWYASNGYVYGALRLEGNNTLNGNIITRQTGPTLGDVSGANTTVGSYGGGNSTINGVISGPGGFSMSHATGGDDTTKATTNITLAGNQSNTYGGKTVVDGQGGVISLILAKTGGAVAIPGGTTVQMGNRSDTAGGANLRMGADNQFGPGVVLNMVGSAWGVNVDLLGTSQTLAGITGGTASALAPGFIENQGVDNVVPAGDGTLTLNGSGNYLYGAYLRDQSDGGHASKLNVVYNGTGRQTLAGAGKSSTGTSTVNSGVFELYNAGYSSPTTVAGGATLLLTNTVNASLASTADISLASGATLTHNGLTDGGDAFTINGKLTTAGTTTINESSVTNTTGQNKGLILSGGLHGSGTVTINALNPGNGVVFDGNYSSTFAGKLIVNGIASTTLNAGSGIGIGGSCFANVDIDLHGTMELGGQGVGWRAAATALSLGALTGDGAVAANTQYSGLTSGLYIGNTNKDATFSGVIADSANSRVLVTKVGSGTQTLSGINTYTGHTQLDAGTLKAGSTQAFGINSEFRGTSGTTLDLAGFDTRLGSIYGSGTVTNSSATATTLTIGGNNIDQTFGGVIQNGVGGMSLTKIGTGTQTFTGAQTFTGTLNINGGGVSLGSGGSLATPTINIGNGTGRTTLIADANNQFADANNQFANATLHFNGSSGNNATLQLHASNQSVLGVTDVSGYGVIETSEVDGYSGNTGTLTLSGTGSYSYNGIVRDTGTGSGTVSVVKTGSGTQTFGGINTYTGATKVNAGTLIAGSTQAFSSNSATTVAAGAVLDLAGFDTSIGSLGGAGTVTNSAATAATLTAGGKNTSSAWSGGIQNGVGGMAFTKTGSGTLTVTGAQPFTGALGITGGSVTLGASASFVTPIINIGNGGGASASLIAGADNQFANATVNFNGSSGKDAFLQLLATKQSVLGVNDASGHGVIEVTENGLYGNATLTLSGSGSYSYNGTLRNAGMGTATVSVIKNGSGTQTFTGGNISYTGTTAINSGTLVLADTTAYASPTTVNTGAILVGERTVAGFDNRAAILGNAVTLAGGTLNIDNAAGGASGGWITFGAANALSGYGTLNINSGVLARDGVTADNINTTATVNVANGAVFAAARGGNAIVGALNGSGTVGAYASGSTAGTLTVGNGNGSGSFTGTLTGNGSDTTDGTAEGGVLSLVKTGTGTQVLSGNNSYAGTTTLSGGTLQVGNNGSSGTLGSGAVIDNGNLIINRSDSTSMSVVAAGGVSGSGNFAAMLGGSFAVDRGISLTGASSRILLEAGNTTAAGTASGGDVTMTSNVSTAAGGTVTVFSGNANAMALEPWIGGATGATRYKTYGANLSEVSGAVAGTRNYYFRTVSNATVTNLSATKTYDGYVAATLSGGTVNAADEPSLAMSDLSLVAGSNKFVSAHAGSQNIVASYGPTVSYKEGTQQWQVVKLGDGTQIIGSGVGTITPKVVTGTEAISGTNKVYDGLTVASGSTLSGSITASGSDGPINGDTLSMDTSGQALNFASAHVIGVQNISVSGTAVAKIVTAGTSGDGVSAPVASISTDYLLTQPTVTPVAASITPKTVTATEWINASNKVYDGLTVASGSTLSGTVTSGLINGDTAALLSSGQNLAFNSAHVASATTISASGAAAISVTGVGVGTKDGSTGNQVAGLTSDYQLTQPTVTPVAASITPKTVTASETITGANKVYDGLTAASGSTLSGTVTSGLINGDTAALLSSGQSLAFNSAHVASATTISASGAAAISVTGVGVGTKDGSTGNQVAGLTSDYQLTQPTVTPVAASITPKTVTASETITGANKVYDGLTAASGSTLSGTVTSGLINGDTAALLSSGQSLAFNSAHVASATTISASGAAAISVTGVGVGTKDGSTGNQVAGLTSDYQLTQPTVATVAASITPKVVTATETISGANKVYDGYLSASGSTLSGIVSGAVNGDIATLVTSGQSLAFDSAHVASATTISASGAAAIFVTGVGAGSKDGSTGNQVAGLTSDYQLTQPTVAPVAANITPRTVSISESINGVNKVYDGLLAATGSTFVSGAAVGVVNGDTATLDTSGQSLNFNSAHVDATAILPTGSATMVLTGGGIGAKDGTSGNAVAGQSSDYSFTAPTVAPVAASIVPRPLTALASIVGADKVYDGLLAATGSSVVGSVSGTVGGDTVTLGTSGYSLTFDNAHAGSRTISASGSAALGSLTGVGAGTRNGSSPGNEVAGLIMDYSLPANPTVASVSANITPRPLTALESIGGVTSKTYDAGTAAPVGAVLTGSVTGGLINGDTATLNTAAQTLAFNSKDVGIATTISASGASSVTVAGQGAGAKDGTAGNPVAGLTADYLFTAPTVAPVAGSITPATLTVTAQANLKGYDGTTTAAAIPVVTGLKGTDSTSGAAVEAYDTANVGSGKRLTATQGTLVINDGNSGANYILVYAPNLAGQISAAILTVTANNSAKLVTTADPSFATTSGVSYSGFIGGDTEASLGGSLSIVRSNGTSNAAGTYTGVLVPSGLTSSNYSIAYVNGNFTIVPASQLLITTANTSKVYGAGVTLAPASVQYLNAGNVLYTLTQTSATGNTYTYDDSVGGTVTFTLSPTAPVYSSSGTLAVSNYAIAGTSVSKTGGNFSGAPVFVGMLNVTPRGMGAAPVGSPTKLYDGTTNIPALALSPTGTISGDGVAVDWPGTGSYASPHAGSALAYTVSGLTLSGVDAGNYYLTGGATQSFANGTISPRPLIITAQSENKTYDGTMVSSFTPSLLGVASGDAFAIGQKFDNAHAQGVSGSTLTPETLSDAMISGGGLASDYAVTYNSASGTITPKTLSLSSSTINAVDKTYDGLLAATGSTFVAGAVTGFVGGDTGSADASAVSLVFNNAHAGTATTVTATGSVGFTMSGATRGTGSGASAGNEVAGLSSDYLLISGDLGSASAAIVPKTLTVTETIVPANKIYDGLLAATGSSLTGSVTSGLANGDTAVLDTSGQSLAFNSTHVGTATTISATGAPTVAVTGGGTGLKDGTAGNAVAGQSSDYRIAPFAVTPVAGTITPRPLAATETIVAADKVYDGLLAASGSTLSASVTGGLVNDDTASLNTAGQSLAFDSAHAGERTINVTGVSTVSVIGGGAGLKDGTAGNATAGQTADYSFISPSVASATATISPKPLAATTTISAVDKVYDGTTLATGSSFTSSVTSGLINGDTAVLNTTGQSLAFDSAHAGSRTVGATGTAVLGPVTGMGSGARDGSSPGNEVAGQNSDYNLMPFVCTPATASITPKTLTLTGASISGADKTYDGLVAATGSTLVTGTVTGFVGADTGAADPGALSLVFNSEHVTAATTISATGNVDYTLNGAARGTGSGTSVGNEVAGLRSDYSFTPPPIAPVAGNITPRGIAAVTGITAEDKRFDASTAAILNTSGASFSGMVAGDALTVSTATGDFDTASPGTNKTVSIVGIALGGASASDYRLLDTTATTFADILPTPVASVETITSSITPTSAVIGLALGQNVAAPVDTALVVVPAIKEGPAASGTQYRITVTESAESKPLLLANDAIGQSGHLRCVGGALRVPNNVRQTVAPCTSGGE